MQQTEVSDDDLSIKTLSRHGNRRWRLRKWSIMVLVAILLLTLTASFTTQRQIQNQERQLLEGRASGIESQLATVLATIESSLDSIGNNIAVKGATLSSSTVGSDASQIFLSGPTTSLAIIRKEPDGRYVVVDSTSSSLKKGDIMPPVAAAAAARAEAADPSRILHMASTGLTNAISAGRIGLAYHPPSLPTSTDIYLEIGVADFYALSPPQSPIISDLAIAIYSSPRVDPATQVISLNGAPLKKTTTVTVPATIGADDWVMTVQAVQPLVGSISQAMPWIVAGIGLLLAVLLTTLIEQLSRRKDSAVALADERTRELKASNAVLSERAGAETLLRLAARDVSLARDLQSAFDRFSETLAGLVPHGTATLSLVLNDHEASVVATGDRHISLSKTWSIENFVDKVESGHSALINGDPIRGIDDSNKETILMPLMVAHQVRALLTVTGEQKTPEGSEAGVFPEFDIGFVERLTRETSGPLLQLIALDREREIAQRLQDLNELKNDFIGMVAHDLRSPMTAITGFGQLLLTHMDDLKPEEKREYIERIVEGGERVTRFAEDVLEVARMDSGELRIDLTEFDLGLLVKTTTEEIAIANGGRPYSIDIPENLPMVNGDRDRHWQVISNLVGNAFKFSDADKPVEVSIRVADTNLRVDVRDHGIGMTKHDADHVFDRFYRAAQPSGRTKVSGTGLGLFITRTLVEAQGGEITVESALGSGTVFSYTVPIAS